MAESIRYTSQVSVRLAPEVMERVDETAAAKRMKPSEYVRRAVIDRLEADGSFKVAEAR